MKELTETTVSIKPQCSIIEKELPLRETYDSLRISKMTKDQYEKAITRDFTELVARSWWISAEGDLDEARLKEMFRTLGGTNRCLVIYSAKITDPRSVKSDVKDFTIEQAELQSSMSNLGTKELLGKIVTQDQNVIDYVSLQGYDAGAGVYIVNYAGESFTSANIRPKNDKGEDMIYGVAVGFQKTDILTKFLKYIFGDDEKRINEKSRFILIAPYDQITKYCTVQNG
jgi:hypothetical protein